MYPQISGKNYGTSDTKVTDTTIIFPRAVHEGTGVESDILYNLTDKVWGYIRDIDGGTNSDTILADNGNGTFNWDKNDEYEILPINGRVRKFADLIEESGLSDLVKEALHEYLDAYSSHGDNWFICYFRFRVELPWPIGTIEETPINYITSDDKTLIGKKIYNLTDGSWGYVSNIQGETQEGVYGGSYPYTITARVLFAGLRGGKNNKWSDEDSGNTWGILVDDFYKGYHNGENNSTSLVDTTKVFDKSPLKGRGIWNKTKDTTITGDNAGTIDNVDFHTLTTTMPSGFNWSYGDIYLISNNTTDSTTGESNFTPEPIVSRTKTATIPTFFTNLTINNQKINPFTKTAVIGIDVVAPPDKDITFDSLTFLIVDDNNPPTLTFQKLVDPYGNWNDPNGGCGIALYKDTTRNGTFDSGDKRVWMSEKPKLITGASDDPVVGSNVMRVKMKFEMNTKNIPLTYASTKGRDGTTDFVDFQIPDNNAGINAGPEFFLVIQPTKYMDPGDKFHIVFWGSDTYLFKSFNPTYEPLDEQTIRFIDGDESQPDEVSAGITYKRVRTYAMENATVSSSTFNDLTSIDMPVDAKSDPVGVIGIDTFDTTGTNKLTKVRVYLNPPYNKDSLGNDNPLAFSNDTPATSILASLIHNSNTSGISIWKDSYNNNAFGWRNDTFLPTMYGDGWMSDYENGFVDGDGIATSGAGTRQDITNWQGQKLNFFKGSDNICWYDADNNGVWSSGDSLWVDNNVDGIFTSDDSVIVGSPAEYTYGVRVYGNLYGFAYYAARWEKGTAYVLDDVVKPTVPNGYQYKCTVAGTSGLTEPIWPTTVGEEIEDGTVKWQTEAETEKYNSPDDIYFIGKGRDRLGWYVDMTLQTPDSLPTDNLDGGPDYFVAIRTSGELLFDDRFSFTLPSNGLTYTTGYSSANVNLTTSNLKGNVNLTLTDLVSPGETIQPNSEKKIIGINAFDGKRDGTDGGKKLKQITVYLLGDNPAGDLEEPSTDPTESGIAIYKGDNTGITLSSITPTIQQVMTLTLKDEEEIPDDDTEANAGDDFYIFIRTSGATSNNRIRAEIRNDLSYPAGLGSERIQFNSDSGKYLVNTNYLTIKPSGTTTPEITIQSPGPHPVTGVSWSGTQTLSWSVTNLVASDIFTVSYKYSSSKTGPFSTNWTSIGSVPAVAGQYVYSYSVNTAPLPAGYYMFKVASAVPGSKSDTVGDPIYTEEGVSEEPILIDNNKITGITINSPVAGNKWRDDIKIQWTITGTEKLNETYTIEYFDITDGTWAPLTEVDKAGKTTYTYTWQTDESCNRRTRIRVTANSSKVTTTTGDFIIDNTNPEIDESSVSISSSQSIIPDVENGNDGRFKIHITNSGWYTTYPTVSFTVYDSVATDDSYAGIKAVAYRFVSGTTSNWYVQKFTGSNQSENISIVVNFEGENIQIEGFVVDDAQNSLTPNDIDSGVSSALGTGYNHGNFSSSTGILNSPLKIDVTPPVFKSIENIRINKLPGGPTGPVAGSSWYVSAPIIYIPQSQVIESGSGVLEGVIAFTVDGTTIPLITLRPDAGGETHTLNLLNGENIVFESYINKIGIEKPSDDALFYFPVYNAYGKQVHVRIWDKAGNISQEVVEIPYYIVPGASEQQVPLYVDTVPPDTRVNLTGSYWPITTFLDVGTWERGYTDTWRHNKFLPRPEDYEREPFVDYIYVASAANTTLTPTSFTFSTTDKLYDIFDLGTAPYGFNSILNKRPAVLLPGDPDYNAKYDLFFSDFKADNSGIGLSALPLSERITTDTDVLIDYRGVWNNGTDFYAVGEKGVVLKYNGTQWQEVLIEDASNFYGIYGTDSNNVYAVGENARIYKFDGNTWNRIDVTDKFTEEKLPTFYSVYANGLNVWVVGSGGNILHSTNDGITWTKTKISSELPSVSDVNLYTIFGNGANIWVGGANGTIIKYNGTNWIPQTIDTTETIGSIYSFVSNGADIYALGDIEWQGETDRYIGYLKNSGVGDTWTFENTGILSRKGKKRLPVYSATSLNNIVYAVGKNGVVLNFDGTTWEDMSEDVSVTDNLYGISAGSSNVIIVGSSGRKIFYDGENWQTENKWSSWSNLTDGSAFTLSRGTTSIEYFAVDKLGNEEPRHKIVDPGRGYVKDVYDGKGTGNIRTDDSGPTVEIIIRCSDDSQRINNWYNIKSGAPSVSLNVVDEGTGVKSVYYNLAGGMPTTPYTGQFNLSDGTHTLVVSADDNLGNKSSISYSLNPIRVDTKAPTTTLGLASGIFGLIATDQSPSSGVASISYKFVWDESIGDVITVSGSTATFPAPSAGLKGIEYWAVDNAGNEEVHNVWASSSVDKTPPQTTISYTPYYSKGSTIYVTSDENTCSLLGKTQFTLTATDPLVDGFASGVAFTQYKIDTSISTYKPYEGPFPASSGDSKIYAYSQDVAGNKETPDKSLSFTVDNDPPTGTSMDINPAASTGWYNSTTGPAIIRFTGTDAGVGIKGIRYTTDGSDPILTNSKLVNVDEELTFDNTQIPAGSLKYAGVDYLENREEVKTYNENILVDTIAPKTTINVNFTTKKFSLTATDNLSGVKSSEYSFDKTAWTTYAEESEVNIPSEQEKIYARSIDIAGNIEDPAVEYAIKNVNISGYVKDYKGNGLKNVKVLIGENVNEEVTTNTSGYYEFTDLSSIGNYYIIPLVNNSMPSIMPYNGIGEVDLTNQNFVVLNGWLSKEYDTGNSNDYRFKTTTTLPSFSELTIDRTIGKGGDILTGDIEADGKLDLIIKDTTGFGVYTYNSQTKEYIQKFNKYTSYTLSLIDSVDLDTNLEILLTGQGTELAEVYNNKAVRTKTINIGSVSGNTKWNIRIAQGNIIFAGTNDDTSYDTILSYNYLSDAVSWDTEIYNKIEGNKLNICVREDGKVMLLFGSSSESSTPCVYALDLFTGRGIWTKQFSGIDKVTTYVSDIDNDGYSEIIAVSRVGVYLLDKTDGRILYIISLSPIPSSSEFNVCISDIDNDGTKEIILSNDDTVYVIENIQTNNWRYKNSVGKVWAAVDFDGNADNKKEIIVSKGSSVYVLNSSLDEIFSYNISETIKKVIVSDINNDGRNEIIVSSATTTYILRPSTTGDLPSPPSTFSATPMSDGVWLVWSYPEGDSGGLKGFRIYRRLDGEDWGDPIAEVSADRNSYKDTPPAGMWYYKVTAYNDFGEVDCTGPSSVLVEYTPSSGGDGGGGGGCFIATAAYGTPLAKEVQVLCQWRDDYLLKNWFGKKFVKFYYKISPPIAEFIRENTWAKGITRVLLTPIIYVVKIKLAIPVIFNLFLLLLLFLVVALIPHFIKPTKEAKD
ncbi:MAG TPA: YCF48-related protein [Candidatus Ratteibacteria bacterium]|nr:YCF48-related protein [Candidatus Ratteibacteria bacterium]